MNSVNVAVIDYGVGNLLSVSRALERCGANVTVTADFKKILAAGYVVLPGVGSFSHGMTELCRHALDEVVNEVVARKTPLLGICLGMQMLLDSSEEFGKTAGLGVIPGHVKAIPAVNAAGDVRKIPHIGWNALVMPEKGGDWTATVLQDLNDNESAYFVHSFMACPDNPEHRIADCVYDGLYIAGVIGWGNVVGCQFHPEKSGAVGLRVLGRFLSS